MFNVQQLRCYIFRLVPLLSVLFKEVGEEEQLQHHEYHKQLYQYDGPKRAPQLHRAETIVIKVEYFIYNVVLSHAEINYSVGKYTFFINIHQILGG